MEKLLTAEQGATRMFGHFQVVKGKITQILCSVCS